jgi:hypothetical protein
MKYFNFYSEEYPYTFGPVGQKEILLTGFGTNKGGVVRYSKDQSRKE